MIEVRNLTKKYGDHTVVNSLSFKIEPGKIYGFLGPNGAGKSTTMNMITGCLAPTKGEILIDGINIFEDAIAAKKKIGYLPEIPPVYTDMTPEEYLFFVAEAKGVRRAELAEQVYTAMEETDILDMKDRLIKHLSKGYRQRVGIAQAMLGNPGLIILDEPTVGLDPRQITEIRELIKRLGQTRTIILSSHILAEVSAVCDHVMILNQGNLVASDTLENIRRENTPDNRIGLTVRATTDQIAAILSSFDEIVSFEIKENTEEANLYDVEIDMTPDADLREALFFAFAERHLAVRRLTKISISLEEIFLQLTDSGYTEEDEEEDETDLFEEDEEEEDTYVPLFGARPSVEEEDSEEENEPEGDDDYRPLFGGSRNTEEEEEEDEK